MRSFHDTYAANVILSLSVEDSIISKVTSLCDYAMADKISRKLCKLIIIIDVIKEKFVYVSCYKCLAYNCLLDYSSMILTNLIG